ncbi:MAG: hypothetical protein KDA91_21060 [Planctomycetaceae bacterium]|nr:hypothetical protein [Planctomycetaceae bacterium]
MVRIFSGRKQTEVPEYHRSISDSRTGVEPEKKRLNAYIPFRNAWISGGLPVACDLIRAMSDDGIKGRPNAVDVQDWQRFSHADILSQMQNFEAIAGNLIRAREQPVAQRTDLLRSACPEIVRLIETDRGLSGPTIFWGRSVNLDEFTKSVIVDASILETILHLGGRPTNLSSPHAGLQHTYGYLFSLIETPFGKKRDRWVSNTLELSLGLPDDVLGPAPKQGTLLSNATWLAGQIAFQGHDRRSWLQRCLARHVSDPLKNLSIDKMPGVRFTEVVALPLAGGGKSPLELVTDLVELPLAAEKGFAERWLLVYSIHDHHKSSPQLVTLFTVTDEFVDALRDRAAKRKRSDVRLRYNAWYPRMTQGHYSGTITLKARETR